MTHQVICKEPGRYLGWPTIGRKADGELLVVFSGDRDEHVCPYGKTQLIRSTDDGQTWSEPETIIDTVLDDRDVGLTICRSGAIVITWFTSLAFEQYDCRKSYGDAMVDGWLAHVAQITAEDRVNGLGHWVRRSLDGGHTWLEMQRVEGTAPHGAIQLDDGRLLLLGTVTDGDRKTIKAEASEDDGATWSVVGEIPQPDDLVGYFCEPHVGETSDGRLVTHLRHERGGETGHYVWQSESDDGGRTWSVAHRLDIWGFPNHLLRLRDGRLLTTYGHRKAPYGERACLSTDGGRTWDLEHEILLRDDNVNGDLGYPATVQLNDHELLTVYYQIEQPGEKTCLMTTRWAVPE